MRVRKFSPMQIPAQDVARAVRFYREVFDLPTQFGEQEERHLFFHEEPIHFNQTAPFEPITVQVVVRDHQEAVENHLINYAVPQVAPMSQAPDGQHVIFHLVDFEGNRIQVIANK